MARAFILSEHQSPCQPEPVLRAKDPCSSLLPVRRDKLPRSSGPKEPGLRMTVRSVGGFIFKTARRSRFGHKAQKRALPPQNAENPGVGQALPLLERRLTLGVGRGGLGPDTGSAARPLAAAEMRAGAPARIPSLLPGESDFWTPMGSIGPQKSGKVADVGGRMRGRFPQFLFTARRKTLTCSRGAADKRCEGVSGDLRGGQEVRVALLPAHRPRAAARRSARSNLKTGRAPHLEEQDCAASWRCEPQRGDLSQPRPTAWV